MENAIWKPVVDFEGLYEVSNTGLVRSVPRVYADERGVHYKKGKLIGQPYDTNGYKKVHLRKDKTPYQFNTHRLVASAFCVKQEGCNEVNHKNEIKDDNRAENLEWCTRKYNTNYGTRTEKFIKARKSKVAQIKDGDTVAVYDSVKAAELAVAGKRTTGVGRAINGRLKTYKGCEWRYVDG